jgi:hypothetical protein
MTRSGLALSILLAVFSASLALVRGARGEQTLDGRHIGTRGSGCPFVGNELYGCGFGLGQCDLGQAPSAVHPTVDYKCAVSEWCPQAFGGCDEIEHPAPQATANSNPCRANSWMYTTGYDRAYDASVYPEPRSRAPESTVITLAKPDDCIGPRIPLHCLRAIRDMLLSVAKSTIRFALQGDLYAEPASLEEYYAMYGGRPRDPSGPAAQKLPKSKAFTYYLGCGDYVSAPLPLCQIASDWYADIKLSLTTSVGDARCRLSAWHYGLVNSIAKSRFWISTQRVYQALLHAPQPVVIPTSRDLSLLPRAYRRSTVLGIAFCLDQASHVLQNASRRLTQLVENGPVEISAQPAAGGPAEPQPATR